MTILQFQMEGAAAGTEPWFGFEYAEAPLPPDLLQGWSEAQPDPALRLPQPNAFIASDFGLVCDAAGSTAAAGKANGSSDGAGANGTAHLQVCLSARCCSPTWHYKCPVVNCTDRCGSAGGRPKLPVFWHPKTLLPDRVLPTS